jgi:hypothetical protein
MSQAGVIAFHNTVIKSAHYPERFQASTAVSITSPTPKKHQFTTTTKQSSRAARRIARFRWFPLLFVQLVAVVCFTATTAFSTTFPLKSSGSNSNSNTYNTINKNGLPSKKQQALAEGGSNVDVLEETNNQNNNDTKPLLPLHEENSKPVATCATNSILPIEPQEKNDKDKEPLNDTEDDDTKDGDNNMSTVPDDQKFKGRIQSSMRTVQNWETVEWLQDCRQDVIPWEELRNATGKYSRPDEDRLLAGDDSNALFLQRLCRWFPKFMTWVNAPPCVKCGCKECEMKTVRGPETEEEKEGNAKRVEGMYLLLCLPPASRHALFMLTTYSFCYSSLLLP